MKSLSSSPSTNCDTIKIKPEIKKLLNSYHVSDLLLLKVMSKSAYETIETYFKSHPVLGLFYKGTSYLSDEIKESYLELEESNFGINGISFELSDNTVCFGDGFCFDCEHMNKILNSSNKEQIGVFYDGIEEKKYIKSSYSFFITLFLMIQLHDEEFDITKFVNEQILDHNFELYVYEGLTGNLAILNGYYKNSSKDQNHRLAAILMYNNIISKKRFPFQKIEQLDSNRLKIYRKTYHEGKTPILTPKTTVQKPKQNPKTQTAEGTQIGIKGRIKKLFGG